MKHYLTTAGCNLMSIVGKWDGTCAIPPDVDEKTVIGDVLWVVRKLAQNKKEEPCFRNAAGKLEPRSRELELRLKAISGLGPLEIFRQLSRNTLHPYLEVFFSHLDTYNLLEVLRSRDRERISLGLKCLRQDATTRLIKKAVGHFEAMHEERVSSCDAFSRQVVKNRSWLTALWVQVGTVTSDPFAPADLNFTELNSALARLTKNRKKKWPTVFAYATALGHREAAGGYFADLLLFFDADEERDISTLVQAVRECVEASTHGQGLFRHVCDVRRTYWDGVSGMKGATQLSELQRQEAVKVLVMHLAERGRYMKVRGVGRTFRTSIVQPLKNRDCALPTLVAAKTARQRKKSTKAGRCTYRARELGPNYSYRYPPTDSGADGSKLPALG